jgi:aromatic-L-amino-acid decarboxylase
MIIADDGGAQISFDAGENWSTYHNQPTAQFYRVVTDDHFPYRIYGAQQDNSTVRISHRTNGGIIEESDWESTAGSESAHIAVDPLNKIADICEQNKMWFHVDGAYGALFMLTEKGQKVLAGIERSQSVALDPHKALQIPYGVGCLLIRSKSDLQTQYAGSSSYMPPSPGLQEEQFSLIDFADISPELSRDPRGLRVWLPLKTFGVGTFKLNLEEKIKLSEYLNTELKKIELVKVVSEPYLTIQTFSLGNSEKTKKLLGWINSQNKVFLSGCEIEGCYSIRICLLGYRLHFAQIQELLQLIKEGLHV